MSMSDNERLYWLQLARTENVGPKAFFSLISMYGTAEAALDAVPRMAKRGGKKTIRLCSLDDAKHELDMIHKCGAELLLSCDQEFPRILRHIPSSPPLLTIKGRKELLGEDSIAIVGARNASANGHKMAHLIAAGMGDTGYVVTSGMASGIDTSAHHASIGSGTIAVLAGGIDHIYPSENKALYESMCEEGLIIAEQPFGSAPRAQHFPKRNRIISGLSLGTIVIEATERSGSLITARYALEQGRDVFAVPGFPLDPRSHGPNKLIREGAILVQRPEDVIAEMQNSTTRYGLLEDEGEKFVTEAQNLHELDDDTVHQKVISYLGSAPITVDDLAQHANLPIASIQVALLELELAGRLERHPGNQVSLIQESYELAS